MKYKQGLTSMAQGRECIFKLKKEKMLIDASDS